MSLRYQGSIVGMICPECRAEARAGCNCGVEYVRPRDLAAKAIADADSPKKSDRVIAAEIGVGRETVRRVRNSTAPNGAVAKRTGKDGRTRRLPQKPNPKPESKSDEQRKVANEHQRELMTFYNKFEKKLDEWISSNNTSTEAKEMMHDALMLVADGLMQLAQKLDDR